MVCLVVKWRQYCNFYNSDAPLFVTSYTKTQRAFITLLWGLTSPEDQQHRGTTPTVNVCTPLWSRSQVRFNYPMSKHSVTVTRNNCLRAGHICMEAEWIKQTNIQSSTQSRCITVQSASTSHWPGENTQPTVAVWMV